MGKSRFVQLQSQRFLSLFDKIQQSNGIITAFGNIDQSGKLEALYGTGLIDQSSQLMMRGAGSTVKKSRHLQASGMILYPIAQAGHLKSLGHLGTVDQSGYLMG